MLEITKAKKIGIGSLTVQERGEAALGHVIEDEQLLPLWPQVVGPERQQVGVADPATPPRPRSCCVPW